MSRLLKVHRCDLPFHIGERLTVARMGQEFSVYFDVPQFGSGYRYVNCYQDGYSEGDIDRLEAFAKDRSYRVRDMDDRFLWLEDSTYPEHVRVPEGL